MAADWGWNPEAVGAIGSAASALLAAVAAGVAVWAGVIAPERTHRDLQRRQLLMIGPRLRVELSVMWYQLELLCLGWGRGDHSKMRGIPEAAAALQCPVISECLASGTVFPEAETFLMAKVQEEAHILASMLLAESHLGVILPELVPSLETRASRLSGLVMELHGVLSDLTGTKRESFIPQRPSS